MQVGGYVVQALELRMLRTVTNRVILVNIVNIALEDCVDGALIQNKLCCWNQQTKWNTSARIGVVVSDSESEASCK
jgi:hypothetical protein